MTSEGLHRLTMSCIVCIVHYEIVIGMLMTGGVGSSLAQVMFGAIIQTSVNF